MTCFNLFDPANKENKFSLVKNTFLQTLAVIFKMFVYFVSCFEYN